MVFQTIAKLISELP